MNLLVSDFKPPNSSAFETVERKGIGHPDTMADLAAELFVLNYAHEAEKLGSGLPNIWMDKTALNGAAVEVDFGHLKVLSPIQVNFVGKFAERAGSGPLNVKLIKDAVVKRLVEACLRDNSALDHIVTSLCNTAGTALDRPREFYRPEKPLPLMTAGELSNDTVVATGFAPLSPVEELAIKLERFMTATTGDLNPKYYGTDVKVQCLRVGNELRITTCLPVRSSACASAADYLAAIKDAHQIINEFVRAQLDSPKLAGLMGSVVLNTKDTCSNFYLAPFGSSLGKGDCGVVGRGNRWEGVIANRRPISMEAPCGKNPRHHGGKVLTAAAHSIAAAIHRELGIPSQVVLACANGRPLASPDLVSVELGVEAPNLSHRSAIESIVKSQLDRLLELSGLLTTYDPVLAFTHGHPPRLD